MPAKACTGILYCSYSMLRYMPDRAKFRFRNLLSLNETINKKLYKMYFSFRCIFWTNHPFCQQLWGSKKKAWASERALMLQLLFPSPFRFFTGVTCTSPRLQICCDRPRYCAISRHAFTIIYRTVSICVTPSLRVSQSPVLNLSIIQMDMPFSV